MAAALTPHEFTQLANQDQALLCRPYQFEQSASVQPEPAPLWSRGQMWSSGMICLTFMKL